MGKYDDETSGATDRYWLFKIANELAEANRLKRIELVILTNDFKEDRHKIDEKLKDKA